MISKEGNLLLLKDRRQYTEHSKPHIFPQAWVGSNKNMQNFL